MRCIETPRHTRLLLAAAVSPLVPPALVLTAAFLAGEGASRLAVMILIAAVAIPFSYAGFLVIGLPLFAWLRRRGRLSATPLLVAGALGGAAVLATFATGLALLFGSSYSLPFGPAQLAWGSGLGIGAAATFCLIAGIRRAPAGKGTRP